MANSLFMFSIQGTVWLSQAKQVLYCKNDIIKITNSRNGLSDSDIIGIGGGNCNDPGWYSITLASLSNNRANGVVAGDFLKIEFFSETDATNKLFDLGTYVVTADDIALGGVVIDFDLKEI